MNNRYAYLGIGLAVIAAATAILRTWLAHVPAEPTVMPVSRPIAGVTATVPASLPLPDEPVTDTPLPLAGERLPETSASQRTERHASPSPLPELPPTLDLTGGRLGQQRVPGGEAVGDFYRLHWHAASGRLFMAVVEPDGMRAIWRLDPDGAWHQAIALNRLAGDFTVTGDSRGRLYAQFENPGRLYRSEDGGDSWRPVLSDVDMFWSMADDGAGTVYGSVHAQNAAVLYRSTDDGFTWARWKDFQALFPEEAVTYADGDGRYRLRHLHGVAYADGKLLVGVGDVKRATYMSLDGGANWREIWDEGFTAAVSSPYGTKLLLGPDTLRRFGLYAFDLVRLEGHEVWSPIPHGYAGYTYSMAESGGVYYVAFHTEANEASEVTPKFGVIVSPDLETWYPFLEYGPLGHHAQTTVYLAPAADRFFVSVNGSLYAFKPLTREWFSRHEPF
jgi:hypothetical protein